METALCQADVADRYRKRLRRAHPQFGLGTLTSAFGSDVLHDEHQDHDYLQAMLVVVTGLVARAGQTLS